MIPLQHGSHQEDLHLWQKFQPCSKLLVWIQSNRRLPWHAQKIKDTIHFTFWWYSEAFKKQQRLIGGIFQSISLSWVTHFWHSSLAESVSTWHHWFMPRQETSIYYFTRSFIIFIFPQFSPHQFCMCAVVGVPADTHKSENYALFPQTFNLWRSKKKKSCLVNILLRGEQEEVVEGENLYQWWVSIAYGVVWQTSTLLWGWTDDLASWLRSEHSSLLPQCTLKTGPEITVRSPTNNFIKQVSQTVGQRWLIAVAMEVHGADAPAWGPSLPVASGFAGSRFPVFLRRED